MPDTYDHITLMCRLKAAQRRNKELESGAHIGVRPYEILIKKIKQN